MADIDVDLVPLRDLPDEANNEAHNFIGHSWFRGVLKPKDVDWQTFKAGQRAFIGSLLSHATVTMATLPGAPELFVGYVVRTGDVAHWVYVKDVYRRAGVATDLMRGVDVITHSPAQTPRPKAWLKQWASQWQYNPYLLMIGETVYENPAGEVGRERQLSRGQHRPRW